MSRRLGVALAVTSLLLGGCFDGCRDDAVTPDGPVQASDAAATEGLPPMSVGTLRGLGAHVWEASLEIRGDAGGRFASRELVSKLIWSELDYWDFEEISAGTARGERQLDRDHYRKQTNGGRWIKTQAPAGNALILQRSLQLWDQAVGGFGPQLAWRELGEDVLDGRPVRVLRAEIAPLPAPESPVPMPPAEAARRMGVATVPLELQGTVYIDLESGNRLLAELDGRFVSRRLEEWEPADEVHVSFREKRTLTSLPPTIAPPPEEQIVQQQRRLRSPGTGG